MKEAFKNAPRVQSAEGVDAALEDFIDAPEIHNRLQRLPAELRARHIAAIEGKSDVEAVEYLTALMEKREAANKESFVSEPSAESYFSSKSQEIWNQIENRVFTDEKNYLGHGQTAKVKSLTLDGASAPVKSIAVKYLLTPKAKTLDVVSEHNLISEVERMERIERIESEQPQPMEFMRVPHPYFYYRNGPIQCYGMEQIDGVDLLKGTEDDYDPELRKDLQSAFKDIDTEALMHEVDRFFDAMHEICLHNDVKPANLMVSREGKFYVIDFGESALATHVNEKSIPIFEALKDSEKLLAKKAISEFLAVLRTEPEAFAEAA